ncbi:NUDIX hydrolase [Streptomyces sp. CB03911]|uniref:NUDIX domain-containing protein n=1 Tax=Streptomyces sp. CB03911 TaxID=1804758 RepID=UPI0018FEC14B|nr:NUDIX hydrolase [Streptomyces sp. CB03911]
MEQLPPAEYLRTLPHGTLFATAHLTDEEGSPLLLRSVYDPEEWQLVGGNLDFGEDPWGCVRREAQEETGLALPEEPGALLAVIFGPPSGPWPFKVGLVFDGGTLTGRRIAEIRLDPEEHTELRVLPLARWRPVLAPHRRSIVEAAAEARRTGRTAYLHLGGPAATSRPGNAKGPEADASGPFTCK